MSRFQFIHVIKSRMKKALIITGIVILIGLGIGAYILSTKLDLIFATIKPTLVTEIKNKTGVDLQFESVALDGLLSPSLTVKNFSVKNPKAEINGEHLKSSLELFPLLKGQIQVTSIEIAKTNIDLKESEKAQSSSQANQMAKADKNNQINKDQSSALGVNIESFKASGLSITKGSHKAENIEISTNIALVNGETTLSNLKGSALVQSDNNINFESPELKYTNGKISTPGLELTSNGGVISIKGDYSLNDKGNLDIILQNLSLKNPPVSDLNGKVNITQEGNLTKVNLSQLSLGLNGAPVSLEGIASILDLKTPKIDKLNIEVAGGKISLFGDQSELSLTGSRLQIPPLIQLAKSTTAPLQGEISQLTLNKFRLFPNDYAGSGNFSASSLSIPGFNLFGEVMGELKDVPILKEVLYANLPAQYQAALSEESTKVKSLSMNFLGNGAQIKLSNIKADSTLFAVVGDGSVTPSNKDGDINLTMSLPKDLSEYIVSKLNGGQGFLNSSGSLELFVTITMRNGKSSVKVKTDKLLRGALKEAAVQALDKALSGKKGEKIKDFLGGLGF